MSKWKPVLMKLLYIAMVRSSLPEVFCKKGDLRNFVKCTEKHLCQSLFFNKVADLNPAILFKKRDWHKCFTVNFTKFLRTPFLQNTSSGCFWMVLEIFTSIFCSIHMELTIHSFLFCHSNGVFNKKEILKIKFQVHFKRNDCGSFSVIH